MLSTSRQLLYLTWTFKLFEHHLIVANLWLVVRKKDYFLLAKMVQIFGRKIADGYVFCLSVVARHREELLG